MIDKASDLWRQLVDKGGLDLKNYDEPLLLELASHLRISASKFELELDRAHVTIDSLLIAVLRVLAPYGVMTVDILRFFADASIRSSAENLSINFKFEHDKNDFDFDLENFRDWSVQFRETVERVLHDEIDPLQALQLRHVFVQIGITYQIIESRYVDRMPEDPVVRAWLADSDARPSAALPSPPTVGDPELQSLLSRVWRFLSHQQIIPNDAPVQVDAALPDVEAIVRGAYLLANNEALLLDRLRDFFRNVATTEVDENVRIEQLFSLFNLPVWKRRSELYSVWVGTRLITAYGTEARVHAVDRSIVFSFGGAHLATVPVGNQANLHVWCELRSRASGLVGKGRKNAIQPDYVVLAEPTSHPDSAILVIECKQYLKQSLKGFSGALIDYARAHRKAFVVLVNYGPASSSVMELVGRMDPPLVARTRVISTFRPGSDQALIEFKELVRSTAPPLELEADGLPNTIENAASSPSIPPIDRDASSGKVQLQWRGAVDLDLYCVVTDDNGNVYEVNYKQPFADVGGGTIELDQDVLTGGGVESVTWTGAHKLSFEFAVHAYSKRLEFVGVEPRIQVDAFGFSWNLQPPDQRPGTWWNLFSIAPADSNIGIRNSISDVPFFRSGGGREHG